MPQPASERTEAECSVYSHHLAIGDQAQHLQRKLQCFSCLLEDDSIFFLMPRSLGYKQLATGAILNEPLSHCGSHSPYWKTAALGGIFSLDRTEYYLCKSCKHPKGHIPFLHFALSFMLTVVFFTFSLFCFGWLGFFGRVVGFLVVFSVQLFPRIHTDTDSEHVLSSWITSSLKLTTLLSSKGLSFGYQVVLLAIISLFP